MKASDALAWILAREAAWLTMPAVIAEPSRSAMSYERACGAHEACMMLAADFDRRALRDVWGRWTEWRWAYEHPEDPILVPMEEGT